MDGILVVDKPAGMTSHDAVAIARRVFDERRIGHAGTLDPDATGVLLLGVGRATRLMRFIEVYDKEYVADVVFGAETSTQDASGEIVAETDASALDVESVERAAAAFVGDIEQIPPMMSAVKVGGERLYRKARRGEEVERAPRRVSVHEMSVENFTPGARARARVRVRCSRGTYVRTLAHDLGRALGVGAHVAALRRVRIGPFHDSMAVAPKEMKPADLVSMVDALAAYPRRDVDADDALALVHGKSLTPFGTPGPYAVVGPAGLVGVAEDRGSKSCAICVLAATDVRRVEP